MSEFVIYGLGGKLKELRVKYNMTQKQVAERFNVHVKTVGKWENDTKMPSLQILVQYAIAFNADLNYLVGIGKESYLYLEEFTEAEQQYIIDMIFGLKKIMKAKDKQ